VSVVEQPRGAGSWTIVTCRLIGEEVVSLEPLPRKNLGEERSLGLRVWVEIRRRFLHEEFVSLPDTVRALLDEWTFIRFQEQLGGK